MTVIDIDALLAPVSADAPCGSDFEYERPFLALQELARGTPERSIGDIIKPAEEPEWSEVRKSAEALFASTKDLRVASTLHMALLKTHGIAGLEAGLCLQRRLLEEYWERVHPELDPDPRARNPAEFRVNALVLSMGEDARAALRVVPLVESRQFGKHSLRDYRIATGVLKAYGPDGEPLDPQQQQTRMEAAFAEAKLDDLSNAAALLGAATEHLTAIGHILLEKADGVPDDVNALATDLRDMKALLNSQLVKRNPAAGAADDLLDVMSPGTDIKVEVAVSGAIRNRSDVVQMIDRICEYYAKAEPSSPVPMILQRAKRLVNKDFMEILRDLTPNGVEQAAVIGGLE